jgi:serine/threonine protein kinase
VERRVPLSEGEPLAETRASTSTGASTEGRCPVCGAAGEAGARCDRDGRWLVDPLAVARSDGDPLLGSTLGDRFVVESWRGLGSTAGVYRGRCLASGRPCVLKVLRDDGPTGALALALAAAEADALGRLSTPRIVSLLAHGIVELPSGETRAAWLALELLGPSLGERARALAPSERRGFARTVLREALLALDELHAAGLAHGDVTPEHLRRRLDGPGWALIDLGSARALGGGADPSAPCSPGYAAPEREARGPSVAADLYAVGRLAAWLVDVWTPSPAGAPHRALGAPTRSEIAIDERDLLRGLILFGSALVGAEPARRPRSAQDALATLERALSG